jgi:hypothetical protein
MPTLLNVPRKVLPKGELLVKETPTDIRALIEVAKRKRRSMITLTTWDGTLIDIKHSLINSMERR